MAEKSELDNREARLNSKDDQRVVGQATEMSSRQSECLASSQLKKQRLGYTEQRRD